MLKMNRRFLLGAPLGGVLGTSIVARGAPARAPACQLPVSGGPFQPTADSLK